MKTLPFASTSLIEHVIRGVVGFAAIYYAVRIGSEQPVVSLGLGVLALVSLRGCPMCWTTGLIGTIHQTWQRNRHATAESA